MIARLLISLCFLSLNCLAQFSPFSPFSPPKVSAGGGGGFTANTAVFDGTDYATNYITPAGIADGLTVTISVWVKMSGGDGALQAITDWSESSTQPFFGLYRNAANQVEIYGYSSGATLKLYGKTSFVITTTTNSGWNHLMWAIDLNDSAKRHIYTNGVEDTGATYGSYSATANINFSIGTDPRYAIGATFTGAIPLSGSLAELWVDDVYLNDVTKFYSGGHPISLGSDGSTPTGSTPGFYFSRNGSGNSWVVDSANGNNFSVSGTLGTDTPP